MPHATSFFFYSWSENDNPGQVEKGYILLHATEPRWLAANHTTLEIALHLASGATTDQAASQLASRYGQPIDGMRHDVRSVADQLSRHGFLGNAGTSPQRSPVLNSAYFHLTTRCNLTCPHCYVASPTKKDIPVALIRRVIDELAAARAASAALSGGELLLHPDIKQILKYVGKKLKVRVLTNGTLIDEEWASFIASELDADVQISIDGSSKEIHDRIRGEGTLKRALRAVEVLQEAGLGNGITFSTTVMHHNLHDLVGITRLAQSLGVPRVRFLPLRKSGRAVEQWEGLGARIGVREYEEIFDLFLRLQRDVAQPAVQVSAGLSGFLLQLPPEGSMDDLWCPVGRMLVLGTDGDVFPCVLMMREELRLGNAHRTTLSEMLHSQTMAGICQALSERSTKMKKCAACLWRNFCQGGCMGQAINEKGTIWDTDSFCEYRRNAYAKAFDGFIERFLHQGASCLPSSPA